MAITHQFFFSGSLSQASWDSNGNRHRYRRCCEFNAAKLKLSCIGSPRKSILPSFAQNLGLGSGRRPVEKCRACNLSDVSPDSLWEDLAPTISYMSETELTIVRDALELAFHAHDGQKRKSGDPFITHPVGVAMILGQLEMDWESVVAGLLHDTVEDTTRVTFDQIGQRFGGSVRKIVEGETKVSKIGKMKCTSTEKAKLKADDLRQMFLAMTEEVRVIIVKLADRLHNMQTLAHMPPHKQKYIAQETLDVFSRLAKLLGMYGIKSELEDLSFMYAHPEEYSQIKKRIAELQEEQELAVRKTKEALQRQLDKDQFLALCTDSVRVSTLCKEPYSIYKKMVERKCTIEEIRDIFQMHIVLYLKTGDSSHSAGSPQQLCYHVLGICHGAGRPVPRTVKDYIATPKPNGYRSLHTTILPVDSNDVCFIEIQIKTSQMEKMAERGIVAYYNERKARTEGKGGPPAVDPVSCSDSWWNGGGDETEMAIKINFLTSLREWGTELFQSLTSLEFVKLVKDDWLSRPAFVFTPKGEVKYLRNGATVVDYAYHIHTDIGNQMIGAKVNGNIVPATHVLSNAEVVEIITYAGPVTSKGYQLHQQWLETAVSKSTRYKISKFLKDNAALFTQESMDAPATAAEDGNSSLPSQKEAENGATTSGAENGSLSGRKSQSRAVVQSQSVGTEGDRQEAHPGSSLNPGPGSLNGTGHQVVKMAASVSGSGSGGESKEKYLLEFTSEMWRRKLEDAAVRRAERGFSVAEMQTVRAWVSRRQGGDGSHGVQWIRINCLDRYGLLAEVSSILTSAGLLINEHSGQTDRQAGVGVMVFVIEGVRESQLVSTAQQLEKVESILSFGIGSSDGHL